MSEPATHPAATTAFGAPGSPNGGVSAKRYLCPYCGQVTTDARRCGACGGHLDPLSRQATQNTMGPWQIHDPVQPFRPGCSFATVRKLIERGQITGRTILRGPTTRQFWTFADRTPSVANLLGVCHNCHAEVSAEAFLCAACGSSFTPETDRQYLGLAPRRPLPGEAPADQVAHLASDGGGLPGDLQGDGAEKRAPRPAFPADPRPPRPKRSPVAVIALVAVAGVIGLSLGAAGALALAARVGLIDLSGEEAPEGAAAGERQDAPERATSAEAGVEAETDAEAGGAVPAEGDSGAGEPAEPLPDAGGDAGAGDAPPNAEAPASADQAVEPRGPAGAEPEGGPALAPAVPPRLRRLP
jgi:hypothetical protein